MCLKNKRKQLKGAKGTVITMSQQRENTNGDKSYENESKKFWS